MKTKAYVRFLNRIVHYEADIELCDVLGLAMRDGILHTDGSCLLFDRVDGSRHPRLARRKATDTGRQIAIGHLRQTLYSSFLKDVYADLMGYLQDILRAAAMSGLDPDRLIGEHRFDIEANDVLKAGGWNEVVDLLTRSLFRQLENEKITKKPLNKMNSKLALGVGQEKIDAVLPFLEIRHLLVHCDGIADKRFCSEYLGVGAIPGEQIELTYGLVQQVKRAVCDLVEEFDRLVLENHLLAESYLQP
ncbi:MAG: hypothetical protein M1274_07210 [Actinobacteria bacterium]|nr:hypothetical protein [Actinomycetota bacterium]